MTGQCHVCGQTDAHLVMVGSPWNISVWTCGGHAVELRELLLDADSPEAVLEILEERAHD